MPVSNADGVTFLHDIMTNDLHLVKFTFLLNDLAKLSIMPKDRHDERIIYSYSKKKMKPTKSFCSEEKEERIL